MPLPSIKRISRSDLKGAPDWVEGLLYPLNNFLDIVYSLLNKRLTFSENFLCSIREVRFSTSATYATGSFERVTFTTGLPVKVTGVLVLQIADDDGALITSGVSLDWIERDSSIRLRYVSGLADSKRYTLKVLVF